MPGRAAISRRVSRVHGVSAARSIRSRRRSISATFSSSRSASLRSAMRGSGPASLTSMQYRRPSAPSAQATISSRSTNPPRATSSGSRSADPGNSVMDAISTRPIGVRTFDPVLTLGLLHRRSTTEISPEGIPVSSRLVKRTPGMYREDAWGSSLRALPKRPFRHLPRAQEACVRRTDPLPGFAGTPPASWGRNPRPLGPPGHPPSKLGEKSRTLREYDNTRLKLYYSDSLKIDTWRSQNHGQSRRNRPGDDEQRHRHSRRRRPRRHPQLGGRSHDTLHRLVQGRGGPRR